MLDHPDEQTSGYVALQKVCFIWREHYNNVIFGSQ